MKDDLWELISEQLEQVIDDDAVASADVRDEGGNKLNTVYEFAGLIAMEAIYLVGEHLSAYADNIRS